MISAACMDSLMTHFVFHFNYSQMKNPYGLDGPTGANIGGKMKDQCCLMQSWDPRTLGRTHIWNNWPDSKISIKTKKKGI